ncbi:MAG: flavin reductase family protein [Burkholderiaceae bacterium]|nr:flavin reductase family protein [Microbacteriaceae bacterium]
MQNPERIPGIGPDTESVFADSLSSNEFKAAFRNHAAGVSLVTADDGTGPVALTATSVFSVSAEPPLLVFSVSAQSSSSATIRASDTVVVHLLEAGQLELAKLGATSGIDRFADTSQWSRLVTGEPVFHGASVWIRGRIISRMDAGTSTIIAVHALQSSVTEQVNGDRAEAEPLVYHNRTWHRLGEHSRIQG